MMGRQFKRAKVDILIGRTVRIRGDVDFSGGLHLDGCVCGAVRAEGAPGSMLSVSRSGCVEGPVDVANVLLNGTVKGDIRASGHLVLGPNARVEGDVHYGEIETAPGAQILGRLVPASVLCEPEALAGEPGAAAGV